MWALSWRIATAVLGVLFLRAALYVRPWGHGGLLAGAVNGLIGLALAAPLWTYAPGARSWMIGGAVLVLLPWKRLITGGFERKVRAGLAELAAEWGTEVEEDEEGELVTVHRPASDGQREAWVGNVLTHVRSLHPGVRKRETYRMLGFVVRLEEEPPFRCTLTKGWNAPAYHTSEWRETTRMQGEFFAMSWGDLLDEGGRETGGDPEALTETPALEDERFEPFYTVACDDPLGFEDVFRGELLDDLFDCAFRGPQFECNVTPTSVNLYTIYVSGDAQRENLAFLDRLADALSGRGS